VGELKRKLKHAFAIDEPGPAEPTPEERVPVDGLCRLAAGKSLTGPALVALELCRPLNWVFAQGMHFLRPGVWAVAPERFFRRYKALSEFLEHRGSIEYMVRRVEHFEQELAARERTARTRRRGSPDATAGRDGGEDHGRD
jgi:hypothetical protein